MFAQLNASPAGSEMHLGLKLARIALVPVFLLSIVAVGLFQVQSASAATAGNCQTVRWIGDNETQMGKLRYAGDNQCFAIYFQSGYNYVITVDAEPLATVGSDGRITNLGDSTVELFAHNKFGVWIDPSFDSSYYTSVAYNDDIAWPTNPSSRIVYDAPGNFGADRLYLIKVAGYGASTGVFNVTVAENLVAAPSPCATWWC